MAGWSARQFAHLMSAYLGSVLTAASWVLVSWFPAHALHQADLDAQ